MNGIIRLVYKQGHFLGHIKPINKTMNGNRYYWEYIGNDSKKIVSQNLESMETALDKVYKPRKPLTIKKK